MTRAQTIWTALAAAACGAAALAVWPARVVPVASAQAPGFPTTSGTIGAGVSDSRTTVQRQPRLAPTRSAA